MPARRVTFVGDTSLTFVNYGCDGDFSARPEVLAHTAHNRVRNTSNSARLRRHLQAARGRAAHGERPDSASQAVPLPSPSDALSSFARDPFAAGPAAAAARALESVWLSSFTATFWLPHVASPSALLPSPQDVFLGAARSSHLAYQNLILQSAAASRLRHMPASPHLLFTQQAEHMREYRHAIDTYRARGFCLSRSAFQDVYSAAYSFVDGDFKRDPAYRAIVYANFSLVCKPENHAVKQLPTVDWIQTLLPAPGAWFKRTPRYQCYMLTKIHRLLDFLGELQLSAHSARAQPPLATLSLAHGTALRKLISDPITSSAVPYPRFYHVCLTRILIVLHLHQTQKRESDLPKEDDDFMRSLESLALLCTQFGTPVSLALFLWGLLYLIDTKNPIWAHKAQTLTFPVKELVISHEVDLISCLSAWLLSGKDGQDGGMPSFDIDELRATMQFSYDPFNNGPSYEFPSSATSFATAAG